MNTVRSNYRYESLELIELHKQNAFEFKEQLAKKSLGLKLYLLNNGMFLEDLVKDQKSYVRETMASKGLFLDVLVHDKVGKVKAEVARHGNRKHLEILLCDNSFIARKAVAEMDFGLDVLMYDSNSAVRAAVAKRHYGCEVLIHDPVASVRCAVALTGYGIDILKNDEVKSVRAAVRSYLAQELRREQKAQRQVHREARVKEKEARAQQKALVKTAQSTYSVNSFN